MIAPGRIHQAMTLSARRPAILLDTTTFRAAFFDMDGLLVDTEPLWFEAERRLVTGLGADFGPEHAEHVLGRPLEYTARYLHDACHLTLEVPEVADALNATMAKLLDDGVPWRPGAEELLGALVDRGMPCALVSASHRSVVDAVLSNLGEDRFAFSVSRDDVSTTKPEPEPYLRAAATLGLDPGECVVFEDSPIGVASAEAAGCHVVAVPSTVPIGMAPGRSVVASLTEIQLTELADGS